MLGMAPRRPPIHGLKQDDLSDLQGHIVQKIGVAIKSRRVTAASLGAGGTGVMDADGKSYAVAVPYTAANYGVTGGPQSGDDMIVVDICGVEVVFAAMPYR